MKFKSKEGSPVVNSLILVVFGWLGWFCRLASILATCKLLQKLFNLIDSAV